MNMDEFLTTVQPSERVHEGRIVDETYNNAAVGREMLQAERDEAFKVLSRIGNGMQLGEMIAQGVVNFRRNVDVGNSRDPVLAAELQFIQTRLVNSTVNRLEAYVNERPRGCRGY